MFIQTEATPNPATLKFIPGRTVLDTGTMEFSNRDAAARSPLAERLFGVPGVSSVFYGYDFVTVTKADGDWQHLKPAILGAIMEHYMSGAPLLADGGAVLGTLCVIERKPRHLDAHQREALQALSRAVVGQLEHDQASTSPPSALQVRLLRWLRDTSPSLG